MTNSHAAAARPVHPAGRVCGQTQSQVWCPATGLESLVDTITSLNSVPTVDKPEMTDSSSAGIVAGTVLRAARLSAGFTQAELAATVDADDAAVAAWEDGTEPLATLPYPVIARLDATLTAAGADPALVHDLTAATWCDLLIEAIASSEDVRCLMADPIAAEQAFAELLTWAVSGNRPTRYRPYAGPGPLLTIDFAVTTRAIRRFLATTLVPSPRAA